MFVADRCIIIFFRAAWNNTLFACERFSVAGEINIDIAYARVWFLLSFALSTALLFSAQFLHPQKELAVCSYSAFPFLSIYGQLLATVFCDYFHSIACAAFLIHLNHLLSRTHTQLTLLKYSIGHPRFVSPFLLLSFFYFGFSVAFAMFFLPKISNSWRVYLRTSKVISFKKLTLFCAFISRNRIFAAYTPAMPH